MEEAAGPIWEGSGVRVSIVEGGVMVVEGGGCWKRVEEGPGGVEGTATKVRGVVVVDWGVIRSRVGSSPDSGRIGRVSRVSGLI